LKSSDFLANKIEVRLRVTTQRFTHWSRVSRINRMLIDFSSTHVILIARERTRIFPYQLGYLPLLIVGQVIGQAVDQGLDVLRYIGTCRTFNRA
jgi:hypothetical protein